LGVVGTVPFSISPGFIAVTRVGSRYPLAVCGLVLAGMAFLGKLTAVLSSVPDAVVGAALLTAMSAGMGVAIEILTRDKSGYTNRDYLVVGLPVLMGTAAGLLPSAFLDRLPDSIRPLAGNGLIVGVVAVLLLEHVVFRRKE
jgi:xanthine/uracil permease